MTTDNLKVGDRVLFSNWESTYLSGGVWDDRGEAEIVATTDGAVKLYFGAGLFEPNGWYRLDDTHIKLEKITE